MAMMAITAYFYFPNRTAESSSNNEMRMVRAQERQADYLERIARSLSEIDRKSCPCK